SGYLLLKRRRLVAAAHAEESDAAQSREILLDVQRVEIDAEIGGADVAFMRPEIGVGSPQQREVEVDPAVDAAERIVRGRLELDAGGFVDGDIGGRRHGQAGQRHGREGRYGKMLLQCVPDPRCGSLSALDRPNTMQKSRASPGQAAPGGPARSSGTAPGTVCPGTRQRAAWRRGRASRPAGISRG